MSKNIVILSDGTGQEGGRGHDTNIYKLFRMLEDRTEDQVVFYDEGLGTETQRLTGLAFGAGIDTNILQCYRFIFDNYESGDKIFLFGFSRGAATVRSLASFIHYFGILPSSRPELITQAYNIYKNRKRSYDKSQASANPPQGTFKFLNSLVHQVNKIRQYDLDDKEHGESAQFVRKHPNQWVNIEFLGVWDTVPALGLVGLPLLDPLIDRVPAWKHQYHNFTLRPNVKHACHALSIDDDRKWFYPSIWKAIDTKSDPTAEQRVEQVWFGGSHTDVGGGFWEAGFSDITLEWMLSKALDHGLRLYLGSRRYWNFCIAPDGTDEFHDPRSTWGRVYPSGKRDRIWDEQAERTFGPPVIHASVLDRVNPKTRLDYKPWILAHYVNDDQIHAAYDRWLHDEYMYQTRMSYERLKEKLPGISLAVWRSQIGNSFAEWKVQDVNSFGTWEQDHVQVLGKEFGPDLVGKKFLVEHTKPVTYCPDDQSQAIMLRDYDREIFLNVWKDKTVYMSIRERVRKINPELLSKLSRAERKKVLSNPTEKDYLFRIDRDGQRWKIDLPPEKESPAD